MSHQDTNRQEFHKGTKQRQVPVLGFRKGCLEVISELSPESTIDFSGLMMVKRGGEKVTQEKETTSHNA